ncbi:hypothetical protein ACROYT_G022493 [Oculina patagonica]
MAFVTKSKSAGWFLWSLQRNVLNRRVSLAHSALRLASSSTENSESFKSMDDLPGPLSLPVIGTSWAFFARSTDKPLGKRFLDIQRDDVNRYGNIYKIEFAGVKMVALADPSDVAKVLRSEPKYPERFRSPVLDYYREKRRKIPGVFFANGPEWYKHRSVLSKRMLRPKQVTDYAVAFNKIITDFIQRVRTVREPSGSEKENEVLELDNELFKWSFESVAEMLFDKRFGCLEPEVDKEAQAFIDAVQNFLLNVMSVSFVPVWFYKIYETQEFKGFVDNFDKMYEYAELFIARRVKELEESEKTKSSESETAGFFEFLLSSGKLNKEDLLASVIDVLFAGVDTTSNTMQWVLYMMAKNPDKQEILRNEVLSVLGNEMPATPSTLAQMPYLKAWVRETLRLYPVLSNLSRILSQDIVIGGFQIPADTQVNILLYHMSRNENTFEDAEDFKPERWLRNKHKNHSMEAPDPFASIPFGFGTRMCIGRRVAELELHLLLARIVQQFEIQYPPDEVVEPLMRGTTIPDRPVRVKFIDRKKSI